MPVQDVILNYIENEIARNSGKQINIAFDTRIDGVPDAIVDVTIKKLEVQDRIQVCKRHEGRDGGERVCSFYSISLSQI